VSVCHINGCALVAYINDLDSLCIEAHPYRHDVAAAKGKYSFDAARF
jgi:hypothetical protein